MEKFLIDGGKKLRGEVLVSGAKNVALKALVAACLTDEEVIIDNVPLISDFSVMSSLIEELGGSVKIKGHTAYVQLAKFSQEKISLDKAAEVRTSSMFLAPLIARRGSAIIPNPGGCRIGARPIDRTIEGLEKMGVVIHYERTDGYFHAETKKLQGTTYHFEKNTHTGTETMLLASVLASGKTVLENAAQEPEIDELIDLLNKMGANIQRISARTIMIEGVSKLHGTRFTIGSDRNEVVTFAIAAYMTEGEIVVKGAKENGLEAFLEACKKVNGGYEIQKDGIRFFYQGVIQPADIETKSYPGFMTDWQSPWAVLMTKANGISTIHETVFESRFGYVAELKKMGAHIEFFKPVVSNPKEFYNFNLDDDTDNNYHAIKVTGPVQLHNGVVQITDLRAGATLVLAALAALGRSVIFGIERLDRGYEKFDKRLKQLGAAIERVRE